MGINVMRQHRTADGRMVVGLRESYHDGKPAVTGQVRNEAGQMPWRAWWKDGSHVGGDADMRLVPRHPDSIEPACRFLTGEWKTRDGRLVEGLRAMDTRPGFLTGKVRAVGSLDRHTRNWRASDGAHDSGSSYGDDRHLDLVPLGAATEALPTPPPPHPFDPSKPFRARNGMNVTLGTAATINGYKWAAVVPDSVHGTAVYKADGTAWKFGRPIPALDLINEPEPAPAPAPAAPLAIDDDPARLALKGAMLRAIHTGRRSRGVHVMASPAPGVVTIESLKAMAEELRES